jgi:hypothetical protein
VIVSDPIGIVLYCPYKPDYFVEIHKTNHPLRTIVNGNNHATENMAEVVEHELMENVCNLKSYIKDNCSLC